ncbi:OmpA family protein [Aestuariivirga sp.]|uniref:OmpA family protein n=1 Tax=Aestuariivirga sp. TaxID=2650926 RepID=UPI0039E48831
MALKQYAALLTDKRCLETKAVVTGHADYIGGSLYNVAISIERAQRVADRLAADGVDPGRLEVAGDGKNEPVDPARTPDARSKNRRVTISIAK